MKIGIDVGGTKTEGILLDPNGTEIDRKRINTEKSYDGTINGILSIINHFEDNHGKAESVGMGMPGAISNDTALIKNANSIWLNGKPFKQDLDKILNRNINIENDANCFTLSEAVDGAGKGHQVVFGVIIGTGVGGGVIINGKTVYGSQGIGGEWGHTIVTDNGDECYCGKRGCVETVISGRALQTYYKNISGRKLKFEEIYATKDNDKYAKETFERLITYFGKGLSNVVNIIDPEVIVLGGGLSNINELYTEGYNELKKYVFNPTFSTPILKPKLGDSAGGYGAALL